MNLKIKILSLLFKLRFSLFICFSSFVTMVYITQKKDTVKVDVFI